MFLCLGRLSIYVHIRSKANSWFSSHSVFMRVLKGSIIKCIVAELMVGFDSVTPRKCKCAASGVSHGAL